VIGALARELDGQPRDLQLGIFDPFHRDFAFPPPRVRDL
jgi:hypothetical protein